MKTVKEYPSWAEDVLVPKRLIKDIVVSGDTIVLRLNKSNIKSQPVQRSETDCTYLVDVYNISFIYLTKDINTGWWELELCRHDRTRISKNTIYGKKLYFNKESDSESIYLEKEPLPDLMSKYVTLEELIRANRND